MGTYKKLLPRECVIYVRNCNLGIFCHVKGKIVVLFRFLAETLLFYKRYLRPEKSGPGKDK